MSDIWLACCEQRDYAQMLAEVKARDPRARLLRFGNASDLVSLADGLPEGATGAVLFCAGGSSDEGAEARAVERTVAELDRCGRARQILVLVRSLDAALIARLFQAGATEVIAAEDCSGTGGGKGPNALAAEGSGRSTATAASSSMPARPARAEFAPGSARTDRAAGLEAVPASTVGRAQGGAARSDGARKAFDEHPAYDDWLLDAEAEAAARYAARTAEWEDVPASEGLSRETAAPFPGAAPSPEPAPASFPAPTSRLSATAAPAAPAPATPAPAAQPASSRPAAPAAGGRRAPVVTAISGRGGVGKTTLIAAMAASAARLGLRAAVLDLDLMFGNMHEVLGVSEPRDLAMLRREGASGSVPADADIEASAMRVGPGLTLWGPIALPEQAELMGDTCEQLIGILRGLADVIFIDTSVYWGDAAAAAVAACDRCLVVGGATHSCAPAARAVELACRLGIPRTRMTSVVTRFGSRGCGEEHALRYELAVSLRSKERVADGGDEVAGMLSFGRVDELVAGNGAFARSVRRMTAGMLRELGCQVAAPEEDETSAREAGRPRLRLPWKKAGEAA